MVTSLENPWLFDPYTLGFVRGKVPQTVPCTDAFEVLKKA